MAGRLGGRRLDAPPGRGTRPTSDRVREALFSTLGSVIDLTGIRFADLYAGSGAVGLEAYSRGADHVLLVESDQKAARAARANIGALGAGGAVQLVRSAVSTALGSGATEPYDVVFADPPYAVGDEQIVALQQALLAGQWLAPDALVVVERATRGGSMPWVDPIVALRERRYGETTLWYGQRS